MTDDTLKLKIINDAFNKKFAIIRDDIQNGRITFHNPPEIWTKKRLDITALNLTLITIAQEAKSN